VTHELITTERDLAGVSEQVAAEAVVALDTEFVSEHTYRPQLCLIQVAVPGRVVLVDPLGVDDLRPFWDAVATPGHETVVHAGREEVAFCLNAAGRPPSRLFDTQVAAGLIGLEYPTGYAALVGKLLGKKTHKGETRTDWRRRPLSSRQIAYAAGDVADLLPLHARIGERLAALGRVDWMAEEMARWKADFDASRSRERWRKVAGSSGLSRAELAVVRELWRWREAEALARDKPARRILRDDLIVELARRRVSDPRQIGAIRGLERGDLRRVLPQLAQCVATALALRDDDYPPSERRETSRQVSMLTQFLSTALNSHCRELHVAHNLVGTSADVQDLIAGHLNLPRPGATEPPLLAGGWRREVVGQLLDDLLDGKVAIRIHDPASEQPLAFERTDD